ncbi:MAG: RimK family protein [Herminiimonas sp.]|nr:RimK family protein [Herminiimonas sp.]
MKILLVVNHLRDWPFDLPGIDIITARTYLNDPVYSDTASFKVFNLCNAFDYQSRGYYVSLLAEARSHQPLPDVKAIEDLHSGNLNSLLATSLGDMLASALAPIEASDFSLDIYFGRDAARQFEQLSAQLFNLLRTPLLHIEFACDNGRWQVTDVRKLCLPDIPPQHLPLVMHAAEDCIKGHQHRIREPAAKEPTLAILHDADCAGTPSNPRALQKFRDAAHAVGMRTEMITRADAERLPQFDGLFIRDTTNVNHYTYHMARQAALAGLVVLDDCDSILKCSNKVYLAELMHLKHISTPKTLMVHKDNIDQIIPKLGLPCVLKQPDGAFCLGVEKIKSEAELRRKILPLLEQSELVIAQEFLPTDFDWRVGVLDGRVLFVCKYYMVPGHWQVNQHDGSSRICEGRTEAISIGETPQQVVDIALEAANQIGNGFYGVDLKQVGEQCFIIEVNDNPNVDAGNEDGVLKDALYREVMGVFRKRIDKSKGSISL